MYIEGDVPSVVTTTNGNGCYGNNGMFGNDWAWIVILLIFGWGANGNGFGGFGGGAGANMNYVLSSDFATLQRQIDSSRASTETKLDSIANGICSLGYDQLAQMNGINTNIMQNGYETRLAVNGLSSQLANCCCDLRAGQKDILYGISTQTNALQNALCQSTRDIVENQNANYRALHDEIVANKIEAKNERIAELTAMNSDLRLKASQEAQNTYLINQLKPCPIPSYNVPNPFCCNTNNCGCM